MDVRDCFFLSWNCWGRAEILRDFLGCADLEQPGTGINVKQMQNTRGMLCIGDFGPGFFILFKGCIRHLSPWDVALCEQKEKQYYGNILTIKFSSPLADLCQIIITTFDVYMKVWIFWDRGKLAMKCDMTYSLQCMTMGVFVHKIFICRDINGRWPEREETQKKENCRVFFVYFIFYFFYTFKECEDCLI